MKLSINKLAEITGQDRRRIKRCVQDLEVTIEGRSHLYESTDAIPALYFTPGYDDSLDLTQERARLAHFQAKKAEIELKALEGEYVSVAEVVDEVGVSFAFVRARLLALPSRAVTLLEGMEAAETHETLKDLIYEALEELSADETYEKALEEYRAKDSEQTGD